ncbi:uncharacterized protein LOC133737427 [Rosa rugosa]|uniref:uncharacterized protein LOC133737427 n=1 Tax=Rosa rugosa TaxID=74645 RepID=UPI002B401A52|nr:uncharacterized protein LOC133737427 [Rosa rugosa]
MLRSLFDRILEEVTNANNYFQQRADCRGQPGFSPHQKVTAAMRMLAYGNAADALDEYLRMGESTARECLKKFCDTVVRIYEAEFLRKPTQEDIDRLLRKGESRGFPGMLGSLDCMHWEWKNCPSGWQGQFVGHYHRPTIGNAQQIVLEAVASYDTWIWHAFFGMPGSHNDISVLDCSHLFDELAEGHGPIVNYFLNQKPHTIGYYLTDGIYPAWGTIVKSISQPQTRKLKYFATKQEKYRKDVERAFGVLQARFAIIKGPARTWQLDFLGKIMKTCIILHNMIVEDERPSEEVSLCDVPENSTRRNEEDEYESLPDAEDVHRLPADLDVFLARYTQLRSSRRHDELKQDLIDHLWNLRGGRP